MTATCGCRFAAAATQALIYKYAPILGPILGAAFIVGLYVLARLIKGDLTDRLKMMSEEEEKKKRQVLKEARIAFLEEEIPALVAKGASLGESGRRRGLVRGVHGSCSNTYRRARWS